MGIDKKKLPCIKYDIMGLLINEIFRSIEGESTSAGFSAVFIRLTGCNLNCGYCDSKYAMTEGIEMSIDEITGRSADMGEVHHITITGGEPMLQKETVPLMKRLIKEGYHVQLETNGSLPLREVPAGVKKIVDVKTPSSGESGSFLMKNLEYIKQQDEFKFVISDENDYCFSRDFLKKHLLNTDSAVNFSPVSGVMGYRELADLILVDRLPVRINLQLHRVIWPEGEPKGKII